MGRNEEIRLMAYYIWLEERCCHGYDLDHWLKAEAIWEQQQKQNGDRGNTVAEPIKNATSGNKKTLRAKRTSASPN